MSRERAKRITLAPGPENVEKIKKVVEEGNYYGAQQMYKSFSARYISNSRYTEALDILQSGACIQLENGQVTCGAELAVLFVETLVKGKFPYDDNTLDRIRKIYKKFPRISVPQHLDLGDDDMQQLSEALGAAKTRAEGCSSFLKACIKFSLLRITVCQKAYVDAINLVLLLLSEGSEGFDNGWSTEFGAHRNGSPEIHDMIADYIYSESPELDMAKVSYHFVRGKDPKKFASTLVNFMGKCYPGEDDLAVARAVLMYLALGNLRDANVLIDEMKKQVQFRDIDFPRSELMQLVNYLLKTLQRDALPLFNMLRQRYKSSIDREPIFNELLDEVAEKFYGVRRKNPMPGMFGEIFKVIPVNVLIRGVNSDMNCNFALGNLLFCLHIVSYTDSVVIISSSHCKGFDLAFETLICYFADDGRRLVPYDCARMKLSVSLSS
ncbi:hypothetical protein DH2020_022993 [Rehmannia glutinosa]|uniref:Pentatricopeptide repeat-containing protein n=1 Tax=Rehmannia glutinosa TaxID=99300 RepID=A0ABR0W8V7_REHGL